MTRGEADAMARRDREGFLTGAGLLAAVSYLCLRGLRRVEERLRRGSGR